MKKFGKWAPSIACVASGLLIVLAFAPIGWWVCAWIALVPLWLAIRTDEEMGRRPLGHGYLVGLVFTGGCFWWVGAVTPTGLAIMLLVLSLYPALWLLLLVRLFPDLRLLKRPTARPLSLWALTAASLWVSLEWTRSWFLTGFNWNELGVSQTPCLHTRQIAALGGVPLLSFVLVCFNVFLGEAVLCLLRTRGNRLTEAWPPALAGLGLVTMAWIYGWWHLRDIRSEVAPRSISYVCVQPNVPEIPYTTAPMTEIAPREVDAFKLEEEMSLPVIRYRPDLLIWPEAITTQRLMVDPLIERTVKDVLKAYQGDFLLGAEEASEDGVYNCAYLLDPRAKSIQEYRKIYLVVLGEYLPWGNLFPWLGRYWGGATSLQPGTRSGCFTTHEGVRLSPFICFEDTQPLAAENASRLDPDFFVTLTNDSWYVGLPAIWMQTQHLQNALLRTVEHDRALIRCANNGISCEIAPSGTIVEQLRDDKGKEVEVKGTLSHRLPLWPRRITLYEKWGNWVSVLSRLVTALAGVCYLAKRNFQTSLTI